MEKGGSSVIQQKSKPFNVLIVPLVEYVLSEKNIELSDKDCSISIECHIEQEAYAGFVRVLPIECKRIFSNLLNNAIEAVISQSDTQFGKISLWVKTKENFVTITIQDNGPGIPSNLLDKIFEEGMTTKDQGNGLGLSHAKKNIESWSGELYVRSEINVGTTVYINLPKKSCEPWFLPELILQPNSILVVVDDSKAIFMSWKQCLHEQGHGDITFVYFKSQNTFLHWYQRKDQSKHYTYLIDYDFANYAETGLDLIKKMASSEQKYLVTSYAEDSDLQSNCLEAGIQLIPKYYIAHIPILMTASD